jgi:hypothetical protein
MQVSAAATVDAGGGDRFDEVQNRALGRAYLAHMYRRYGSWPDAIAAYNWGPGHLDEWIGGGRSPDKFPAAVERYRTRVLVTSGLAAASGGEEFYRWANLRLERLERGFACKPNEKWLNGGVSAEGRTRSSCSTPKSCDRPPPGAP